MQKNQAYLMNKFSEKEKMVTLGAILIGLFYPNLDQEGLFGKNKIMSIHCPPQSKNQINIQK